MTQTKKKATKAKAKFDMAQKLKDSNTKIKAQSVAVYVRNAKRVLKLANLEEFPSTSAWLLKKPLLNKFDDLGLEKRRPLSVAAVKMLDAYGIGRDKSLPWVKRMNDTSEEYDKKRNKRQLTEKEKKKIPEGKWDDFFKFARFTLSKTRRLYKKALDSITKRNMFEMQKGLILSLYSELPLRLTFADLLVQQPDKKKQNYIYKTRNGWWIQLENHKTVRSKPVIKHKLSKTLARLLNKFNKVREKLTDHPFLLSNKAGKKMSKTSLSKLLSKLTNDYFGKGFSTQIIRILFATKNRKALEIQQKVSEKLGHNNSKTTFQYSRKT